MATAPLVVVFSLSVFPFFSFCGGTFRRKSVRKTKKSAVRPSRVPIFLFFLRWGVFVRFSCFFTKKETENGSFA